MSTRFANSVKIGTVYLTSDGTAGGTPLKALVPGESRFASAYAANSVHAADGTPHTQIINRGVKGVAFDVRAEYCPESLIALVVSQLNTALAAGTTVRVIVDSQTDFDVMAVPVLQDGALYTFESRSGGIARGVLFKFLSVSAGA